MNSSEEPCVFPRDGNDPYVYSKQASTGPFSLLIGSEYDNEAPPPTYIMISRLNTPTRTDFTNLLQGHSIGQEGGLVCEDKNVLEKQRGVILDVIKSVASCLIQGKGIVGLSLPIRLFEPRSTLERMLDRWSFMSVYMNDLRSCDPMERFKRVITMAVAGLYPRVSQEKPFNPLLGETLQADWPNGTQAYCEHTSHHPPITNFYVIGKDFKMHGHYELTGKFKKNSLVGGIQGPTNITFYDGQVVSYRYPTVRAGGIIFGTRTANYEGDMEFHDTAHGFTAIISFGAQRKKSLFRKAIGKLDDFKGAIFVRGQQVCPIEGSWLRNLTFDGFEYWNVHNQKPVFHSFFTGVLPSDWRYREDLIWLYKGNPSISQNWKVKIENRQRQDRTLRLEHRKRK